MIEIIPSPWFQNKTCTSWQAHGRSTDLPVKTGRWVNKQTWIKIKEKSQRSLLCLPAMRLFFPEFMRWTVIKYCTIWLLCYILRNLSTHHTCLPIAIFSSHQSWILSHLFAQSIISLIQAAINNSRKKVLTSSQFIHLTSVNLSITLRWSEIMP